MTERAAGQCQICGGQISYQPAKRANVCTHCGAATASGFLWHNWARRITRPAKAVTPALVANDPEQVSDQTSCIPCRTCGAEIMADKGILAKTCPFCQSLLVRDDLHQLGHMDVSEIIPFAFDIGPATNLLLEELRTMSGLPKELRRLHPSEVALQGVYLSFYVFDVEIQGTVDTPQTAGILRHPRIVPVDGWVSDILVPASDTLGHTARLASHGQNNWNLEALERFHPHYLAGFVATLPAFGLAQARKRYDALVHRNIEATTIKNSRFGHPGQDTTYLESQSQVRLVLLPVWLGSYVCESKIYRVVVNAQTGEVGAEVPALTDGDLGDIVFWTLFYGGFAFLIGIILYELFF